MRDPPDPNMQADHILVATNFNGQGRGEVAQTLSGSTADILKAVHKPKYDNMEGFSHQYC